MVIGLGFEPGALFAVLVGYKNKDNETTRSKRWMLRGDGGSAPHGETRESRG